MMMMMKNIYGDDNDDHGDDDDDDSDEHVMTILMRSNNLSISQNVMTSIFSFFFLYSLLSCSLSAHPVDKSSPSPSVIIYTQS